MQKKFLLGGMILTSGLGLASGAFANTNTNTPEHLSEFNILSSTDIASLSSLTPSERDSFLRSK